MKLLHSLVLLLSMLTGPAANAATPDHLNKLLGFKEISLAKEVAQAEKALAFSCESHGECPGVEMCYGGYCVRPGEDTIGMSCDGHMDCSGAEMCYGNACVPPGGSRVGGYCSNHMDCPGAEMCYGNTCTRNKALNTQGLRKNLRTLKGLNPAFL